MILQNPSALWGLFLLAIPILVHLFDFRRIKKIQFSNVAFLHTIQKQNTPRKRLKDLLILLARLFALAFLVFAFSDPILPAGDSLFSTTKKLLVVDNSRSMASPCGEIPCIGQAKIFTIEAAKSFEEGQVFYQGAYRAKRFIDAEELNSQLDQLALNKGQFSLKFDEDVLTNRQLAIISDFQEGVVDEVDRLARDSISLLLIPIHSVATQNLYVDSVFLQNPFSIGDNKRILGVRLSNSGSTKIESALVRVYNADRQLSSVAVSIEAGASETTFFEIENSSQPAYRLSVEDYEVDFDNDYFFTLPSFESIKISVIGGENNRAIEAVFENPDYFDLKIYSNSSIDFERFFSSDLVIIHSMDQLPEWFDLDRLTGDLIIVPSPTLDLSNYSSRLEMNITVSQDSTFSQLKSSGFKHPFFDGLFDELDSKTAFPNVKNLYNVRGATDELLIADRPYLQRFDGENKVYWFNSPLVDEYSELQNHALFLPILYRIAEVSRGFNEALAHVLTDGPIQINVENRPGDLLELAGENGEYVPSFYFNQSSLILTLPPDLNDPGVYYLLAGADTLKVLALNSERKESIMDRMDADELSAHFASSPNVKVLASGASNSLNASLSELSNGKELWKYAFLLALLFLVVETALHRWLK